MTEVSARPESWAASKREREHELLAQLSGLDESDPARASIRDELVEMNMPLVRYLARGYRERGESLEDLVQVGTVGLLQAIDRFDQSLGYELSTFATYSIVGEIKRHFRDHSWSLHVPRRLQDIQAPLNAAMEELTATLGRSPTVREVAAHMEVGEDQILDALEARTAYGTVQLDAPNDDGLTIADRLGSDDPALDLVEYRHSLRPLLEQLPDRERQIILLRFFHNKSQSEIAKEVGISQMHVSRLLTKTLAELRDGMQAE